MASDPGSGAPQSRKLGLAAGTRFEALGAPDGWALVDPPPLEPAGETADVLVVFVRAVAELEDALAAAKPRIFPAGAVWIAWPRKAAGHASDVTDNAVRSAALACGLVDVKVAAIDTDWSGLKVVWRVADRGAKKSR